MKTIYKSFLSLALTLVFSVTVFGGNILVKTTPLGEGITGTGYVRIVVKITDKHIGRDLGIILHEAETFTGWNQGIGLMMFENVLPYSQFRGYNGSVGTGAWDITTTIKNFNKGDQVAIWFKVDIANAKYSISTQSNSETTPVLMFEDFTSRASIKSELSTNAKFCTIFANDAVAIAANGGVGVNTAESIQIISDAQIVSSIEPYTFAPAGLFSTRASESSISVYPTLADEYINIASDEEIKSVKIYSLLGEEVYNTTISNKIPVSGLSTGTYIVEATTVNNNIARQSFLKK